MLILKEINLDEDIIPATAKVRLEFFLRKLSDFLRKKGVKEESSILLQELPKVGIKDYCHLIRNTYGPFILELVDKLNHFPEEIFSSSKISESPGNKVFIVHGHDEANRLKLIDLLKTRFKVPPSVILETPGRGRTIIEMIEEVVPQVCFAFVLMTPDDEVIIPGEKGKPVIGTFGLSIKDLHTIKTYSQSRPNVLIELGLFYGAIGRQNVCLLLKEGTELPSDLDGIKRIQFKDSVKEVIEEIEKELRAVGLI
jgi:hypothetical protein